MTRSPADLPAIWGPAIRTVMSPDAGAFSVHAHAMGGFEALPMDLTASYRAGIAGFYGETIEDVVEGIRNW